MVIRRCNFIPTNNTDNTSQKNTNNSGTEVVKLWYGNGGRLSILTLSLLLLIAVLIGGFDFDFI